MKKQYKKFYPSWWSKACVELSEKDQVMKTLIGKYSECRISTIKNPFFSWISDNAKNPKYEPNDTVKPCIRVKTYGERILTLNICNKGPIKIQMPGRLYR